MGRVSFSIPLVALLALGCARAETAQDKQLAEMEQTMASVQRAQDKEEPIAAKPTEGASTTSASDARAVSTAVPKAAPRAVRAVSLGEGDDDDASDDPADPTERPEIKVTGGGSAAGAASARRGRGGRDSAGKDQDLPRLRDDSARPSALDPDAKKSYEAALQLVHDKQYPQALEALSAFLVRWPDHPYAENATYWRGESLFAQGEYQRASTEFDAILTRFGSGTKAPDALLKLGMCQDKLGQSLRARETWDRLKADYPKSDAAKKIPGPGSTDRSPKGPKETR